MSPDVDVGATEERAATVAEHLEQRYGVRVTGTAPLDLDVFRVDLEGAPSWVARVFPAARPRAEVEGTAAILRALEDVTFPAERCATADPVCDLDGESVLVTDFVEGEAVRDGRAYAVLASLLGRLHAATETPTPGPLSRPGGAWHHVATGGSLEAELEATETLLRELGQRLPPRDRARASGLRRRLAEIDLEGLPEALLHPDCAPPNVVRTPEDRHVLVDWAGVGRGPRVWSLGFLLYATGGRPRLVELVCSYYARQVALTEAELEHLPEAILERQLVLSTWMAVHRDRPLIQVEADADTAWRLSQTIATQARPVLRARPTPPPAPARRRLAAVPPPPVEPGTLPLSALLSQAWVAWTIELDNAYEAIAPHTTTRDRRGLGPWLTSSVMWWNCLRHLPREGAMSAAELEARARLPTNLDGMERWRYVDIQRPRTNPATWVLSLTRAGRRAAEIWAPLPAEIDRRWEERWAETARLREALVEVVVGLDPALPDCLPVVGPGNAFLARPPAGPAPEAAEDLATLPLGALLARALYAYTLEAERGTRGGLAFREDLLRLLDADGVQVRRLPELSGVSVEAQQMALGILERGKLGEVGPDPKGSRYKVARLNALGVRLRDGHAALLREVDAAWASRTETVRELLTALVADGRLRDGLTPPPGTWRAALPPQPLPHYPMVLHRGGFPDGA